MNKFTPEELAIAKAVMDTLRDNPNAEVQFKRLQGYWIARVVYSLYKKSVEQVDPRIMLNEWHWNGVESISEDAHDCALCGHKETIYTFRISNKLTGHEHECGSVCITRFMGVANKFTESNYDLDTELKSMQKAIRIAEEAKRRELIISALETSRLSDDFKSSIIKLHTTGKGSVTPAQASVLIDHLDECASGSLKLRIGMKQIPDATKNYEKLEHLMTSEQANRTRPSN